MQAAPPLRIGIIGYDGINAIDLAGPAEAFVAANDSAPGRRYEVVVIGLTTGPFRADSGVVFLPNATFETCGPIDTLLVPGGSGLRVPAITQAVATFLQAQAPLARRVASICTGIYGLAPTGLMNGRKVTTHWRFASEVARRFPALIVERDLIFVRDGKFYTSGGVTAGLDLSLALIEEDCGPKVALKVARELVMYLKRPGGQEQFSEPLRFQTDARERFSELTAWIVAHLQADLSVEALARKANLCPRHFSRSFKERLGQSPAAFVEELRLVEATRRLGDSDDTIDRIAASLGFGSADSFRRSFERRYRVSPTAYRHGFSAKVASSPLS